MIKQEPRKNDGQTAERLWRGALEILNGKDKDWKHSLAKDLDDDEFYGRSHIRETIACAMEARNPRQDYYAMKYFLQAMTHASILDCLSIDTCVGGLYNFFSGANGSRAVPALQRFCDSVLAKLPGVLDEDWADLESAAVALSTALREVLKREQRARLHDDLAHLIDSMHGLATSLQGRGVVGASAQLLHHVGEIRAVVGRARGLLSVDDAGATGFADTPASAFPRVLHPPGGRHDNDNSDIAVIKIFPTRAEILSEAAEFLPSTDLEQPHFLSDKSQRHIDTLFRLLRQDTFGELKDVLASTLRLAEANRSHLDSPKLSFGNLRANRYSQAIISCMSFDSRRGLEADISFSQPRNLRDKTAAERQRWWEESRRLSEGVLVSFIAAHQGRVQHLFLITSQKKTKNSEDENLTKQGRRATITLRLTSHAQEDIETLMGLSSSREQGVLVEFPGVIPATFMPVLENMQNMQRLGAFPFQDWILPEKTKQGFGDTTANIPPPRYARKPGFAFSLKPILKGCNLGKADLLIAPDSIADLEALIGEVEAETDLDRGQCRALVAALCREFALIQGPPGTGKSYLGIKLMSILLNCQAQAELGPIVVVCYTNHALDQFLEHILKDGTKKVIRIGGQSHSAVLEGHNLRAVTQSESKSRFERYSLAMSYQDLDAAAESIKKILGRAHGALRHIRWENMQKYLSRYHPDIAAQFAETDEDGFEIVGRHPFDIWASLKTDADVTQDHGGETELDSDAILRKASISVNSLSASERQHLMDFWSMDRYKHAVDDLVETIEGTSTEQRQVSNIHDEVDRRVLQEADVIGITTTGLAKRMSTLQRLKCKVVICEEAGEVMEPHILSALLPTVEHIIQIGDHEQLRPQINNFGLSLESKQGMLYQLDRSQFERLSVGISGRPKIPLAQLEVQRRMRPSISSLVRETLYPDIQDHPSTCDLPDVVGMRKNLFWLDHSHLEAGESAEMHHQSHSNDWEVGLVHALVRHIVRQGVYSSSDIAVLTPYTGQLQKLRASMRNDFEVILSDRDQDALNRDGIDSEEPDSQAEAPSVQRKGALAKKKLSDLLRVATVDNFQGEEAKVVIVSLVRSNNARKVGFLKTTNRINVLLSRAQHGMYLIGNAETYTNVKMWQTVIELMRAEGCTPCVEKCEWSCEHQGTCAMPCSATCTRLPCNERCAKLLSCGHRCPAICGEVCPEDLCKDCGESQDSRVDLLEMKTYTEIDVDVDPIVVLGCGHFFTAETLDGLVGMHTAYVSDVEGRFTGLVELSGEFAKMPQCPDCKRPVRQYATRRYNRIVNRAVADESARRFLVAGKEKLKNINMELEKLQGELAGSQSSILRIIKVLPAGQIGTLGWRLQIRYGEHKKLHHKIKSFCNESSGRYQPHHKLYEATIHALRGIERNSLSDGLAALSMQGPPRRVERDCRVALAGEMALVKLDFIILEDMFDLLPAIEAANLAQPPKWPGGSPLLVAKLFLKSCSSLISRCRTDALPKLAVEAILYHARMAHMYGFRPRLDEADRAKASGFLDEARENLETASSMCEQPFQDADTLKEAVRKITQLLQAERYEAVSPEEIAAIKKAMLSGRDGMATHFGHWYNCVNGHPFAIGECGMPMEQARCPECGAPIGGQNHQSVPGVTRADAMEN
ncbi:NF-X1 finger and helicase domain-containing protein [Cordyceps javanica]|uniref:NF-X1 finger and helicase domain-containing protein n=1 Tax=Cordyceps javanica TaxID=43265 RepID=A0A545VID4_9HYPO|nr:NF-X1 finger and helicase domain-containing protein [Cordyceps javanica]TQW01492.1 NF-X1 finger and helicase domain protein [Cordyceps javanica]